MYKRKYRPYPPIVKRRRVHVDFQRWLYAFYSVIVFVLVLFGIIITHLYLKMNNDLYLKSNSSLSLDESR